MPTNSVGPVRVTVDGKTGLAVYLTAAFTPTTPENASMVKVVFDDGSIHFGIATNGAP